MANRALAVSAVLLIAILAYVSDGIALGNGVWTKMISDAGINVLLHLKPGLKSSEGVGEPTRAIKNLDSMLDQYKTGSNLTPEEEEFNKQLKRHILYGTFDIRELSKLSLGEHWNEITTKDQDEFVQLMTDILENKAILSKEQGKKKTKKNSVYQVSYKGDTYLNKAKSRAFTKSSVYVPSEKVRVEINYKLRLANDQWKIYDVILDGSSLVDNYNYQFDSIIKKHGYPDLVRRMKEKRDEVKKERDGKA